MQMIQEMKKSMQCVGPPALPEVASSQAQPHPDKGGAVNYMTPVTSNPLQVFSTGSPLLSKSLLNGHLFNPVNSSTSSLLSNSSSCISTPGSGSGFTSLTGSQETAFPFPPPSYFSSPLTSLHPHHSHPHHPHSHPARLSLSSAPWLSLQPTAVPPGLSYGNLANLASGPSDVPGTEKDHKSLTQPRSRSSPGGSQCDPISSVDAGCEPSVAVTQMNATDKSNSVNMTHGPTPSAGNRPAQESNLKWLADVAVESSDLQAKGNAATSSVTSSPRHLCSPGVQGSIGQQSREETTSSGEGANTQHKMNDLLQERAGRLYSTHPSLSHIPTSSAPGPSIFQYNQSTPMPMPMGPLSAHHMPHFMAAFYQSQFSPSGATPSSPFLVPTPPASAPPTGRPTYFGIDLYHQAMINAVGHPLPSLPVSSGSSRSLSLSSHRSSISPSALISPVSGPVTSPLQGTSSRSPTVCSPEQKQPYSSGASSCSSSSSSSSHKEIPSLSLDPMGPGTSAKSSFFDLPPAAHGSSRKRRSSDPDSDLPPGREGSLKHRILRPPDIKISPGHFSEVSVEVAPFSAPPIPREHLARRFNYSSFASSALAPEAMELQSPVNMSHDPGHCPKGIHQLRGSPKAKVEAEAEREKESSSWSPSLLLPTHLQFPAYFRKGSIIQLGDGLLTKVEDMKTQDFISSASMSPELRIDTSIILKIEEKTKDCLAAISFAVGTKGANFTADAPLEHPFYVYHKGWSSCSPERSRYRYGLDCHRLKEGDTCISLTKKQKSGPISKGAQGGRKRVETSLFINRKPSPVGSQRGQRKLVSVDSNSSNYNDKEPMNLKTNTRAQASHGARGQDEAANGRRRSRDEESTRVSVADIETVTPDSPGGDEDEEIEIEVEAEDDEDSAEDKERVASSRGRKSETCA